MKFTGVAFLYFGGIILINKPLIGRSKYVRGLREPADGASWCFYLLNPA